MRVRNLKPCAVVLNGALVITPLATVEVDDQDKGALDLIASGVLEVDSDASEAETDPSKTDPDPSGKESDPPKDPVAKKKAPATGK